MNILTANVFAPHHKNQDLFIFLLPLFFLYTHASLLMPLTFFTWWGGETIPEPHQHFPQLPWQCQHPQHHSPYSSVAYREPEHAAGAQLAEGLLISFSF